MDQTLKEFRRAVHDALEGGGLDGVATAQVQKRLAQSPGWESARRSRKIGYTRDERHVAKGRT